jgi:glycosyltransferase involved in cell wall biosynthesis
MNKERILFCGNALPILVLEELKLSLAGKKYEISLLKELNDQLGERLDILSLAFVDNIHQSEGENIYLFNNKRFNHIHSTNYPIARDIFKNIYFFIYLMRWSRKNKIHKRKIILLNSSLGNCLMIIITKIIYNTQIFSLTIDTPFPNIKSKNVFYRLYLICTFKLGHNLLKYFNGIIVLNENVISSLKLKIPFLVSKVGYSEDLYNNFIKVNKCKNKHGIKKILFAGTLIDYNGIIEMIEGFILINRPEWELHIYGYGNLEKVVRKLAKKNKNVFFHGAIDNITLLTYMQAADLLINPRLTYNSVNDFGFPSKLIEYMMSGIPVLTTDFNSLPSKYKEFLHLIEEETAEGIKLGIEKAFKIDQYILDKMSFNGADFIRNNNNWNNIARDILKFIDN